MIFLVGWVLWPITLVDYLKLNPVFKKQTISHRNYNGCKLLR